MKRSLFLLAILLILQTGAFAQKKVILDAMKDELTRSMQELKLDGNSIEDLGFLSELRQLVVLTIDRL